MSLPVGTCRLCGETRPLLRESHLVPSSLYRHMKPGSARFGLLATGEGVSQRGQSLLEHASLDTRTAADPVAVGLLCASCDNDLLGRLDFYGHHVLAERLPGARQDGDALIIEPIHYGRLKLFLWSVIWRAAASADDRFAALTAAVPLEDLRQRLLTGTPGEPELHPVSVTLLDQAQPWCLAPKGHPRILLVAGRYGLAWGGAPTLTRERLLVRRADKVA